MTYGPGEIPPQQSQPPGMPPSVVGDAIKVGGRYFRVVPVPHGKGEWPKMSRQQQLQRAVHDLSKCTPEAFESACLKIPAATAGNRAKVKVQFTSQGPRVSRIDGYNTIDLSSGKEITKEQKELPQFELHEVAPVADRSSSEYWKKNLALHVQHKGFSKEAVTKAVDSIFQEGHLSLVDILEGNSPSEWGEKTISDLLQEPGNEGLREALLELKDVYIPPEKLSKKQDCYTDLKIFILKNIQRTPRVVPLENGSELRQQFVKGTAELHQKIANQSILSADDIGTRGKGLPSEADKEGYRDEITHNNTNLGTVKLFGADNTPLKVVAVRSGKSDTFERLQEHVLEACIQQLTCQQPKGLTPTGEGAYDFQHAITTYLDTSKLKAAAEYATTGSDEREYLDKILRAANEWPDEGIKVNLVDADGQLIQVTLIKPIICSQLLSSTVRGAGTSSKMGQKESDAINFMANTELLMRHPGVHDAEFMRAKKNFDELIKRKMVDLSTNYLDLLQHSSIVKSKEAKAFLTQIWKFLEAQHDQDPLLAQGLTALIFEPNMHVADMEIMRNIVLDKLNISKGKQCKSGTDRTAIGIALACAQEAFVAKYGLFYDPMNAARFTDEMHLFFKTEYRASLKEMGVSIVCETKGYSGIKWGGGVPFMGGIGNPSSYKYLYLEHDMKLLGKEPKEADVLELTSADLYKRGSDQYKGILRDTRAFYGKSDKDIAKELTQAKKRISQESAARTKAIEQVKTFIYDNLRLKNSLQDKPIIAEGLELALHIKDLHLDEPIIEGGPITRGQILKAHIEELTSTPDRPMDSVIELYILQQIHTLWEQIKHSSGISTLNDTRFTPPASPRGIESQ